MQSFTVFLSLLLFHSTLSTASLSSQCLVSGGNLYRCKSYNYCKNSVGLVCGTGNCGLKSCPSGWIKNKTSCFYINSVSLNHTEAEKYCKKNRSTLIKILNQDKSIGLEEMFFHFLFGSDELFDFKWSNGATVDEKFWKNGNPNNNRNFDEKTVIAQGCALYDSGKLNDKPCSNTKESVCEFEMEEYCNQTICNCLPYQYWNGTFCVPKKNLNQSCEDNSECKENLGLVCITKKCICNVNRSWNTEIEKCIKCPIGGWFLQKKKCYKFFDNTVDKTSAVEKCKCLNSTLIEILTNDTLNFAIELLKANSKSKAWTGSELMWQNGAQVSLKKKSIPNSVPTVTKDCVKVSINPDKLVAASCSSLLNYICEMDELV